MLAAVALAFGLTLPVVQVRQWVVLTGEYSLLGVVADLWNGGEVFLSVVVGTFTIVLPMVKLGTLAAISWRPPAPGGTATWLARLHAIGRWSMMDVFVLALLIFYFKSTSFGDATSLPGIYFFAASVLLTGFAAWRLERNPRSDLRDTMPD